MNIPFVDESLNIIRFSDTHYGQVLFRTELPKATLISDFLMVDECAQVIQMAHERLNISKVVGSNPEGAIVAPSRTSYDVSFRLGECPLITTLDDRISNACNWVASKSTGLQVIRYRPGEFFAPHYDYIAPELLKQRGEPQRVATLMIYLNDVEVGGETIFEDAGIKIAPKRGAALFFSYQSPRRASMTRHMGAAPCKGDKWVAVKWLSL